jgi:zinc protease
MAIGWLLLGGIAAAEAHAAPGGYAVVVSQATQADVDWQPVVDALVAKHAAAVIGYAADLDESLAELKRQFPRYVCFVAKPEEATKQFVAQVHRLTRKLDDDPYTDALWGILTGYDATCALRIAQQGTPLVIERVASGTEIALDHCTEGLWYSELDRGRMTRKSRGGQAADEKGPADTTQALADSLNQYQAQLFVTSGHATERDWQIGFRYRNGQFRCAEGQLYGLDTAKQKIPINSTNPKVYLPIGNCLMGHIDSRDAMALAFMNSAGVDQMIGYTVLTWYGYAGWGLLDYFVEQPGRFTLAEAFFANQQALLHRLESNFPGLASADGDAGDRPIQETAASRAAGVSVQDARGLLYDRDALALYGDPAWSAKMQTHDCAWEQTLSEAEGKFTLEIKPRLGAQSFDPVNTNGSQRGGRPIFALLAERIEAGSVQISAGADLRPIVTDNFVLVPLPAKCDPERSYRVTFSARKLADARMP